jgi:hypothetical protein
VLGVSFLTVRSDGLFRLPGSLRFGKGWHAQGESYESRAEQSEQLIHRVKSSKEINFRSSLTARDRPKVEMAATKDNLGIFKELAASSVNQWRASSRDGGRTYTNWDCEHTKSGCE